MNKDIPTISRIDAIMCWEKHIKGNYEVNLDSVKVDYIVDSGNELTSEDLAPLCNELEHIIDGFETIGTQNMGEIDSNFIEPIHKTLSQLIDTKKLVPGFWLWFNNFALNGAFCKLIEKRHEPQKGRVTDPTNWGIPKDGKFKDNESYFTRIWKRGDLMYDNNLTDPYINAKRGKSKLWRFEILSQKWIENPEFVVAFLDTVCEKGLNEAEFGRELMQEVNKYRKANNVQDNDYMASLNLLDSLLQKPVPPKIIELATKDVKNLLSKNKSKYSSTYENHFINQIITEIYCRGKQKHFRKKVRENCGFKCVVTDEPFESACHACHIVDVRHEGPFTVDNGLFMRADWHQLFDNGEILINDKGIIELNADFEPDSEYKKFANEKINLPPQINQEYLNWKYNTMKEQ